MSPEHSRTHHPNINYFEMFINFQNVPLVKFFAAPKFSFQPPEPASQPTQPASQQPANTASQPPSQASQPPELASQKEVWHITALKNHMGVECEVRPSKTLLEWRIENEVGAPRHLLHVTNIIRCSYKVICCCFNFAELQ